ncbi:DUF3135 domain-containing protein [Vibrio nereis]|uniref:DUF3135 domain-containing protein n=1 Tax=Vibrio nereis TaxID=693 RepID=A0A0M0HIY4_VIBNE|nr:DUF3135 domain-containing protein [Vibrio nereis]KOO01956.1 hypothetical protein AKJ17_17295 [Vibrio nereis]
MESFPINQMLPPFDELAELAKNDPQAFDALKRKLCREQILSSSLAMQDRLWAQQSHIDLVISHCKNPHHVNVELMKELMSQLGKFQHALQGDMADSKVPGATVVQFDQWR